MHTYICELATSRIRVYCRALGLSRLETATCTQSAKALMRNGNHREAAIAHAIGLADRIKARKESKEAERKLYRTHLHGVTV